jgi:hypothetical protein
MTEARLDILAGTDCDEARALASLDLDDALDDELGRRFLKRHLEDCADCREFVTHLEHVTALLRDAPLERFTCGRIAPRRRNATRTHWASTAVAVLTVGLGVASLPKAADHQAPLRPVVASVDVPAGSPVKLPIGQKSAEADFTAGLSQLEA